VDEVDKSNRYLWTVEVSSLCGFQSLCVHLAWLRCREGDEREIQGLGGRSCATCPTYGMLDTGYWCRLEEHGSPEHAQLWEIILIVVQYSKFYLKKTWHPGAESTDKVGWDLSFHHSVFSESVCVFSLRGVRSRFYDTIWKGKIPNHTFYRLSEGSVTVD